MKITILTYLDPDEDAPDVVVGQVRAALEGLGHEVSILGIHSDVQALIGGLAERAPELVFNLVEMWGDDVCGDVPVIGLLELLGYRHSGGGPGEMYLAQDKALAKKILAYEGILYPRFAVFTSGSDFETGGNLKLPLFVKPLRMDASIGIDGKALVTDLAQLLQRVTMIQGELGDAALAEEYIDGREFAVGVVGNKAPLALPPIEIDFTGFPEGKPRILDSRAKWEEGTAEFKGTRSIIPELPDELRARLHKVSLDAYRALRVKDYGRVDLRLTPTGDIYVLEVNASCYLEATSDLAFAAAHAGISHDELIGKIVAASLERYER